MYGDLTAVHKLEARFAEAFPNGMSASFRYPVSPGLWLIEQTRRSSASPRGSPSMVSTKSLCATLASMHGSASPLLCSRSLHLCHLRRKCSLHHLQRMHISFHFHTTSSSNRLHSTHFRPSLPFLKVMASHRLLREQQVSKAPHRPNVPLHLLVVAAAVTQLHHTHYHYRNSAEVDHPAHPVSMPTTRVKDHTNDTGPTLPVEDHPQIKTVMIGTGRTIGTAISKIMLGAMAEVEGDVTHRAHSHLGLVRVLHICERGHRCYPLHLELVWDTEHHHRWREDCRVVYPLDKGPIREIRTIGRGWLLRWLGLSVRYLQRGRLMVCRTTSPV